MITHSTLSALTPKRLYNIVLSSSRDYIIPHVSLTEFEAWESQYPELTTNRKNHWIRYTHGYSYTKAGIRCPALIVQCVPSKYHEACAIFITQRTYTGLCSIGGDADLLALDCADGPAFGQFVNYSTELSLSAQKQPDAAIMQVGSSFPSIVFEIGFSEDWDRLLEDAKLFLRGTGGKTKYVALIKITEELPESWQYVHPTTKNKVSHWIAERDKLHWPTTEEGEPPAPEPPMVTPGGENDPQVCIATKQALFEYYVKKHKTGTLFPPLVFPLSGILYLYSLRDPQTDDAADSPTITTTDPNLHCVQTHPFLSHDMLPESTMTKSFSLALSDLYVDPTQIPDAAKGLLDSEVTYDMRLLANRVLAQHEGMMARRALERAGKVWDKWVHSIHGGGRRNWGIDSYQANQEE